MKLYFECGTYKKVGEFRDINHAKAIIIEVLKEPFQICPLIFISEWGFFSDLPETKNGIKLYLQRTQFFKTIDVLQPLITLTEDIEMKEAIQALISEITNLAPSEKINSLLEEIKQRS
jgi:hypothetical protein